MLRFIGRTVVLGALAAGALTCVYGKDQVITWFHQGKEKVARQIDEFQGMTGELTSIEGRVRSLEDEVKRLREQSIREEVEVEHLQRETGDRKEALDHMKKNLEKAQSLLTSAGDKFAIGGVNYGRAEVERDVADKIELYKVQQETLGQLEQTLEVHKSALALAKENAARGENLRGELQGKVRLLQAKLEKHRAREVYADAVASDFDQHEFTTELGEVRGLFAKFETKLEVKGRMLDERMKLTGGSRVGGIDYDAPDRANPSGVMEKLSALLATPQPAPAPSAVVIVQH